jgi:hypothetical protein
LSCWSGGYAQNAWMAYCNSTKYGVYDVDAAWFGVEPEVASQVARAQVLTLSDSHLQNALSLGGASEWFAKNGYAAYFLGFPNGESGYGEMLLDKFKPHPRVVIFDTSPYFTGKLGQFENSLLADAAVRASEAGELHEFQHYHQIFCDRHSSWCGHNFAYFRSRIDGHWIFPKPDPQIWFGRKSVPNDQLRYPTEKGPDEYVPLYATYLAAARKLVAKLDLPPQCIVITHVPSEGLDSDLAPFLAKKLGVSLVDPPLDGRLPGPADPGSRGLRPA